MLNIEFEAGPSKMTKLESIVRSLIKAEELTYSIGSFIDNFTHKLKQIPRENVIGARFAYKAFPSGGSEGYPDKIEVWHLTQEGERARLIATVFQGADTDLFNF